MDKTCLASLKAFTPMCNALDSDDGSSCWIGLDFE